MEIKAETFDALTAAMGLPTGLRVYIDVSCSAGGSYTSNGFAATVGDDNPPDAWFVGSAPKVGPYTAAIAYGAELYREAARTAGVAPVVSFTVYVGCPGPVIAIRYMSDSGDTGWMVGHNRQHPKPLAELLLADARDAAVARFRNGASGETFGSLSAWLSATFFGQLSELGMDDAGARLEAIAMEATTVRF